MEHQATLLFTLATAFVMASALGFVAARLRIPPLVGYLLAGIAIGPFTPGFHADSEIASQLAEIGVILLMFGVGLHFSLADLMAVRGIAVPGSVAQIVTATIIGTLTARLWGWPIASGLVLGLALSVASTVVILRALEERGAIESADGRIAVAWTVVEDLAMVLTLVLLPALASMAGTAPGDAAAAGSTQSVGVLVVITILKVATFFVVVKVAGPRLVPWILQQMARTGSHELFTVSVLAVSLGIAYGASYLFGVSFALGAFCAGVVLSNSELSHRAAEESLPLQHAFAVIFFVSVGMLFDPGVLVRQPLAVLAVLLIILVGKSVAAFVIVQVMGYPIRTALIVSAALAQIGEFSFILAGLGIGLGLLPTEGRDLILAGSILSLAVNPLVFMAVNPVQSWIHGRRWLVARFGPAQDLRLARLQVTLDANRQQGTRRIQPDELVNRWPVFADIDLAKRGELLSLLKPRAAVPGERLIRKGDAAGEVFFISSGAVEVSVAGRTIKLGPGDLFGEMGLLSDAPRNADVTAIDYCQLFTLDKADFQSFIGKHADLHERIDRIAAEREAMNARTASKSSRSHERHEVTVP